MVLFVQPSLGLREMGLAALVAPGRRVAIGATGLECIGAVVVLEAGGRRVVAAAAAVRSGLAAVASLRCAAQAPQVVALGTAPRVAQHVPVLQAPLGGASTARHCCCCRLAFVGPLRGGESLP